MRPNRLILIVLSFVLALNFWASESLAQDAESPKKGEHDFDIGIIIDNRRLPASEAARADVDGLIHMLDQQMYLEHVLVLERPTINEICGVFGCPETIKPADPFPSLIWQITRERVARLVVYYIGEGRAEGLERQLLFRRNEGNSGGVVPFAVNWLHRALDSVRPESVMLMLDTSFSPRPLPCANEDPHLIDDALLSVRQNYQRIARNHWNIADNLELSATTPVQPPHCDRFDHVLEGIEQPLFTKLLLRGVVEGEADREPYGDDDRLVDLGELQDYLDDRIGAAARFQWGRRQNVRAVGSSGHVLASVDGRELSDATTVLLDRRSRPPQPSDDPEPPDDQTEGSDEQPESDVPVVEDDRPDEVQAGAGQPETPAADRCAADPGAPDCHPCVVDPEGDDCARHCRENSGSDLCASDLFSATDTDADVDTTAEDEEVDVVVVRQEETAEPDISEHAVDDPSLICGWTIETVSPYASALVQRISGDTATLCSWATELGEPELGPFAQIFTPIGWRLGRPVVQDVMSCIMDCGGLAPPLAIELPTPVEIDVTSVFLPQVETAEPGEPVVDPRSLGPFQREICDRLHEELPPYIGLPRWMPGTLIISEVLRSHYDCPPLPPEPTLPVPMVIALADPTEDERPADDDRPVVGEPPTDEGMPSDGDEPAAVPMVADQPLDDWPSVAADIPYAADIPQAADINVPPGDVDRPAASEPTESPEADIETADATPPPRPGEIATEQPLPEGEERFDGSPSQVRWLQSALTVDSRSPGPIDGRLGRKTMEAVQSWRRDNGRAGRTSALTKTEFQAIIEQFGERFDQILPRVSAF